MCSHICTASNDRHVQYYEAFFHSEGSVRNVLFFQILSHIPKFVKCSKNILSNSLTTSRNFFINTWTKNKELHFAVLFLFVHETFYLRNAFLHVMFWYLYLFSLTNSNLFDGGASRSLFDIQITIQSGCDDSSNFVLQNYEESYRITRNNNMNSRWKFVVKWYK